MFDLVHELPVPTAETKRRQALHDDCPQLAGTQKGAPRLRLEPLRAPVRFSLSAAASGVPKKSTCNPVVPITSRPAQRG